MGYGSNIPSVLIGLSEEDLEPYLTFDDDTHFMKTLGLPWDLLSDLLLLSFSSLQPTPKPSPLSMLPSIARIYDSLGLVGPFITMAKIFL